MRRLHRAASLAALAPPLPPLPLLPLLLLAIPALGAVPAEGGGSSSLAPPPPPPPPPFPYPCAPGSPLSPTDACDASLRPEDRARAAVSQLNVDEKASQLGNEAPPIPRLAVPAYQWWTEALHGVLSGCTPRGGRCPTSYPCALNLAAAFDSDLVGTTAAQISDEARALHSSGVIGGLDFWSPNINIVRDPRWGRAQETPGEDPILTGRYAVSYIGALQDEGGGPYLKAVATPKHFAVYNLEHWGDVDRSGFDARTSSEDLWQTYLPAFEMAVREGRARSVMCSYNAVNGVPSCANGFLLRDVLRGRWGFDGYVVSDCGAVGDVYRPHEYNSSYEDAAVECLRAGTDLNCGSVYNMTIGDALRNGRVEGEVVDGALTNLFSHRIRLGLFDDPREQPYNDIDESVVDSGRHRAHARRAAAESVVLLKNGPASDLSGPPLLPLKAESLGKVAVIGPNAASGAVLCSNYHGMLPETVSVVEGLRTYVDSVGARTVIEYSRGCDVDGKNWTYFPDAVRSARSADAAVVVLGLDGTQENEGRDRTSIRLPGLQEELLKRVLVVQPNTVLVIVAGGAVDLSWAKERIPAILHAFYPGEEGGNGIVDVLFGRVNPSGRMPYTMYAAEYVDSLDMTSMDMRAGVGRTYRFFTGEAVYPFGRGLSYTTFGMRGANGTLHLPPSRSGDDHVQVPVIVENTGSVSGSVSVLGFVRVTATGLSCPMRQLFDFQKVHLDPGASAVVNLDLRPRDALCVSGSDGGPVTEFVVGALYEVEVDGRVLYSFRFGRSSGSGSAGIGAGTDGIELA